MTIVTEDAIKWSQRSSVHNKQEDQTAMSKYSTHMGGGVLRASVAMKYFSVLWREPNVVPIPKADDRDYSFAKSCRPICLTSFLLKMLENIIKRYLR